MPSQDIDLEGIIHYGRLQRLKGPLDPEMNGFARVNIWVSSLLSRVADVSSLGQFGAR
jgi:hypothetical protein